ncbi:MAG: thiamine pyrophosphate-requiring protein [Kofleriaceae bacterium]
MRMLPTVSDIMLERLVAWGVRTIYGYGGEGSSGLESALTRANDRVRWVRTSDEQAAAAMAFAHAKLTGELGACLATSSSGAVHLLTGLHAAHTEHAAVVAILGQSARMTGVDYHQDVDLHTLLSEVAPHRVHECQHPEQIRHVTDRALRIALAERAISCLVVDVELQDQAATAASAHPGYPSAGTGFHVSNVVPAHRDLQQAAALLDGAARVAMLVGAGALNATSEVMAVAAVLGAGVAKALLGKAVLPDELPYVTGALGLLGTQPSLQMMKQCDALLVVGSSFPYIDFLPDPGQAATIQIDISPRVLGSRYPVDIALHGDAALTLRALLPLLHRRHDREWRDSIEGWVAAWWQLLERRAHTEAIPINPQRVFWELSPRLPADAIVTADSGSCANWWARDLKVRAGMIASLSGNLATPGPALSYAVAAKFAFPNRPVIAAIGDGAFQLFGNGALTTITSHCKQWPDHRLVVVVLNTGDLGMMRWEQRMTAVPPKLDGFGDAHEFPYARYANLIGLQGIGVDRPDRIGPALDWALSADRPTVVEIHVDPAIHPVPPHIPVEQARQLLNAIIHGEPDHSGRIPGSRTISA